MAPANVAQHLIGQGLGIDADAGDTRLPQRLQLFLSNGVRAAGFHGKLPAAGQVKLLTNLPTERGKLPGTQSGGGSPANVHGDQRKPQALYHLGRLFQLHQEQGKIGFHQFFSVLHILGNKGTVRAPGGAKGDGHIQTAIVFPQSFHRRSLGPKYSQGQVCLRGAHMTMLLEVGGPRLFPPFFHILAQQFHRVNAREHPPGWGGACQLYKAAVEQVGHGVLLQIRREVLPDQRFLPIGDLYSVMIWAVLFLYAGKGPGTLYKRRPRFLHLDRAVRKKQPAKIFTFVAERLSAEKKLHGNSSFLSQAAPRQESARHAARFSIPWTERCLSFCQWKSRRES